MKKRCVLEILLLSVLLLCASCKKNYAKIEEYPLSTQEYDRIEESRLYVFSDNAFLQNVIFSEDVDNTCAVEGYDGTEWHILTSDWQEIVDSLAIDFTCLEGRFAEVNLQKLVDTCGAGRYRIIAQTENGTFIAKEITVLDAEQIEQKRKLADVLSVTIEDITCVT